MTSNTSTGTKETRIVPLDQIQPNTWNPHGMTNEELDTLQDSLQESGQWRPIVVVELDEPDEFMPDISTAQPYRIIDGEHLHRAMTKNALAGKGPDKALVLVYAKNSEVSVSRQMEIGQTINHGMRGSLEDLKKTGLVVDYMLKFRSEEEISRRTGQSLNFINTARRVYNEPPRRRGSEGAVSVATRGYEPRKGQTVPLVFEDDVTLSRYLSAIQFWEKQVDPKGMLTPGRRRIAAVLAAVESQQDNRQEEAE